MTTSTPTDPERTQHSWGSWTDEGEGPLLVAIHGLPGSVRDFRYLGGAIGGRFRLVRIDLPGFGESPAGFPPTAAGTIAFIDRVLDELGEPAFVLGHSFGSTSATAYASARPERVRGLALLGPFGLRPHRGLRRMPRPSLLNAALNTPLVGRALESKIVEAFEKVGFKNVSVAEARRTIETISRFSFDAHKTHTESVDCPTLVAWAKDDRLIEPEIVRTIVDLLPDGPRMEFETGGHNMQKSQAVEIADALYDWITLTES